MANTVEGQYHAAGTGAPRTAQVAWAGRDLLQVVVDGEARLWGVREAHFTWERSGDALRLSHGAPPDVLVLRDPAAVREWVAYLRGAGKRERQVATWPWLLRVPLMLPLGFIALCAAAYFLVLPWLAGHLVDRLPHSVDVQLGDVVSKGIMGDLQVDSARTVALQRFGDRMELAPSFPLTYYVVEDTIVNAFAMPGGRIVVYTGLLDRMDRPEQLAALLAHEATHVERRHSTRGIARKLSGVLFIGVVFGDASGFIGAAAAQADELKGLHYSRALETEADTIGIRRLVENGVDPEGMVQLLEILQAGADGHAAPPEFLSSHPETDQRMATARAVIALLPKTTDADSTLHSSFQAVRYPKAGMDEAE